MYIIVFVLLLRVLALPAVPLTDCGSTEGHFTAVTISNCTEEDEFCIFERKSNVTISIQFDVDKDITAVNVVVHAILADVPVSFPVSNPDACAFEGSGLRCPLKKDGGPNIFTATELIEKATPKLLLKVKWQLQNQDEKDIICLEFPAKIQ